MIALSHAAVVCFAGAFLLWMWSVVRRDVSVVDAWWGIGFVAAVWIYRDFGPSREVWHSLNLVMVTLWGLRLGAHIGWRSRGEGEDRRYANFRKQKPKTFWWRSLFTVFGLQALLVCLISYPLLVLQTSSRLHHPLLFWIGAGFWLTGFLFEAVADFQMLRFKENPANRGRVLDQGLWRWSRHPNYFGESVLWWGFGLMAAAAGGFWSLLSPLFMTFLLLRVSGVSLLERTITSRRPEYRDYQERTSAFFPWFSRRGDES